MKTKLNLVFLCLLMLIPFFVSAQSDTRQGKEIERQRTVESTLSGSYVFDSGQDPLSGRIALFAQAKSGEILAFVGDTTNGFAPLALPTKSATYLRGGVYDRNPILLRGNRLYVSTCSWATETGRTTLESLVIESETRTIKSLLRKDQTVRFGNLSGTVTEMFGPGVSPDGTKLYYWLTVVGPAGGHRGLFQLNPDGSLTQIYENEHQIGQFWGYNSSNLLVTKEETVFFVLTKLNGSQMLFRKGKADKKPEKIWEAGEPINGYTAYYVNLMDGLQPVIRYSGNYDETANSIGGAAILNDDRWGNSFLSQFSYGSDYPFAIMKISAAPTHNAFSSFRPGDTGRYNRLSLGEPTSKLFAKVENNATDNFGYYAFSVPDGVVYTTQRRDGNFADGYERWGTTGVYKISWPIISEALQTGDRTRVRIPGFNLDKWGTPMVMIGGIPAQIDGSTSPYEIIAFVPPGITGNVPVTVRSGEYTSQEVRVDISTPPPPLDPPVIESLEWADENGNFQDGGWIAINGQNFDPPIRVEVVDESSTVVGIVQVTSTDKNRLEGLLFVNNASADTAEFYLVVTRGAGGGNGESPSQKFKLPYLPPPVEEGTKKEGE